MPRLVLGVAAAAALAATPGLVAAQGFQVNEHGTCVMGRAGVGTPKPCDDGSAIFYNPAGIGGMSTVVSLGVTGIYAYGGFEDDYTGGNAELQNSLIPVPHLFLTYGFTPKITAGLGVFVPYGLGTVWPETFEGRFNGYDNDLRSIYIQPTVGWKLHDMFSIGAGLDFVIGSVKLTQKADLSEQAVPGQPITFGNLGIPFHTDFATGELTAHNATGFGGNFGILFEPSSWISIGARYLTKVKLDYDGDVAFTQSYNGLILPPGNPISIALGLDPSLPLPVDTLVGSLGLFDEGAVLGPQTALTSITMPDQISIGVAVTPVQNFTLMGEWQYVNWSVFDTLTVDFERATDRVLPENYKNTHGFRFGAEWLPTGTWTLRGGYLHHQGAAPPENVTPLLPEGDRNEFTAGFGFRISSKITADLAYQNIRQNLRRGRVTEPHPGATAEETLALNSGLYKFNAHLFGLTVTVNF